MFRALKNAFSDLSENTRVVLSRYKRPLRIALLTGTGAMSFFLLKGELKKNDRDQEEVLKNSIDRIIHPDSTRPQNTADFKTAQKAMLDSRSELEKENLSERQHDSLEATALYNEAIITALSEPETAKEKHSAGEKIVENINDITKIMRDYNPSYHIDAKGRGVVDPNKSRKEEWQEVKKSFKDMFEKDDAPAQPQKSPNNGPQ
jgi:hypothetical protein